MSEISQSELEHDSLLQQLEMAREAIEAHKGKVNSIVIFIGYDHIIETFSAGTPKDIFKTVFEGSPRLIAHILKRIT